MSRLTVLVLALAPIVGACKAPASGAAPATAQDMAAGGLGAEAMEESAAPESIDDLESRLADYEGQLRGAGVQLGADLGGVVSTPEAKDGTKKAEKRADAPAAGAPLGDAAADERAQADRCERICTIAQATCELADRICDLASRHQGEQRYRRACARGESDCEVATRACQGCAS